MVHLLVQVVLKVEVLGKQEEDINLFVIFNLVQMKVAFGKNFLLGKCTVIDGILL